jgi:hypothetical protein
MVRIPARGGSDTESSSCLRIVLWQKAVPAPQIGETSGYRLDSGWDRRVSVAISIIATTGPARSRAVTVAGRTVTVTQDSGCTFSRSATSQTMPAPAGVGTRLGLHVGRVSVERGQRLACITITGGASGSGAGNEQFAVEPNATGTPRSEPLTHCQSRVHSQPALGSDLDFAHDRPTGGVRSRISKLT